MSPVHIDRRAFLRSAAIAGGSAAAAGLLSACADDMAHDHHAMTGPDLGKGPGGGGTVTRYPLQIPAVVGLSGLTLRAAPRNLTIIPGKTTPAWVYNDQFPGPTIQVNRNAATGYAATFQNGLSGDSIIHWHGILASSHNDGHPHQIVTPGASYFYGANGPPGNYANEPFIVDQRAALNWYHPHPHMITGEQVYRGLAGAFIVRDSMDTGAAGNGLGLPVGAYEVPLIIRDASFDSRGAFQFSNKSSGFWGNTPLVNGTYLPHLVVNRGVYRFRVLNGCNARVLRLALNNGAGFLLIGNDGGLLPAAVQVLEITAAPGERFDVLVNFGALTKDATVMLRDLDANWDILEFKGSGVAGTTSTIGIGTLLDTVAPLAGPARTRVFTFDGMTRINGKVYDINAIEFGVPFGEVEHWRFITNGNGPHPVHVHGAAFQVIGRTGGRGRVYPWEQGWKDTVLVNDGETVDVLIRFTAHRGLYVMHCHQLAHEDAGMMANFEVV